MASRDQKVSMIRRVLQLLGLAPSNGHVDSITETIARMDAMENRAVTMSLAVEDMTEEQKHEMGLAE